MSDLVAMRSAFWRSMLASARVLVRESRSVNCHRPWPLMSSSRNPAASDA